MDEIVVGVDGSERAAAALRWAVREGELHGTQVVAVMVWSFMDQRWAGGTGLFSPVYREEDAGAALDAAVAAALGCDGVERLKRRVLCDLPASGLLDAAKNASLLVVGDRGQGRLHRLLLGSVSEQCLHHAQCPVAVVREVAPASGPARERIVVGVDGSATSRLALRWALNEARLRRAAVEVVHAWHPPYVGLPVLGPLPFDHAALEAASRETLDRIVAEEDTSGLAVPVERILVVDGAAGAILDTAKGADLIVLGSRGLGGFAGLLLGSVSHHVAHHATCSVVVVPPEVS